MSESESRDLTGLSIEELMLLQVRNNKALKLSDATSLKEFDLLDSIINGDKKDTVYSKLRSTADAIKAELERRGVLKEHPNAVEKCPR